MAINSDIPAKKKERPKITGNNVSFDFFFLYLIKTLLVYIRLEMINNIQDIVGIPIANMPNTLP